MKMTNEQAIKQMNEIIACWEDFLTSEDNNDLQGTGLELEALRMAVQALREKSLLEVSKEDCVWKQRS